MCLIARSCERLGCCELKADVALIVFHASPLSFSFSASLSYDCTCHASSYRLTTPTCGPLMSASAPLDHAVSSYLSSPYVMASELRVLCREGGMQDVSVSQSTGAGVMPIFKRRPFATLHL